CALDGHNVLIHSPNITLNEDSTDHTEFSNYFDLDGDQLVWMNTWAERKIEEKLVRNRIYLMNLSDNTTMMIAETPDIHHEYAFRPPIPLSGRFVVFSEAMNNNLFLYDTVTGRETSLTSDGSAPDVQRENAFPDLDGDRVVWSKRKPYGSAGDLDIVFMNLSTGVSRDICILLGDQKEPALSGQRIVWTDTRNEPEGGDIYLYDMGTGTETAVCTERGLQQRPKISGNSVVWMDYRDGNPAVYVYNISYGRETRISRDNFVADAPLLSGNLVVWQEYSVFDRRDERMGSIVVFDTAAGTREILPTGTVFPQLLAVDDNRILYANPDEKTLEEGFIHLFEMDIHEPPSPPAVVTPLLITATETPAMVFGPAKTVTQSAPGSPAAIPVLFIALTIIFHTRTWLGKK
ncbi:TolB family protein, partial [Methanoregula sp.]|uniref:TolB family protein n=1 Tax=Methanoregula sp. TaxID=2052170 RepID=UPI000CAAEB50